MTPKEAAEQIVRKYYPFLNDYSTYSRPDEELQIVVEKGQKFGRAKQCAILHCQGIIEAIEKLDEDGDLMFKPEIQKWEQVLNEIEKL